MATPLINPLRISGGTFYTFSSAVADIQKTFTDDDARFVFSKFALLNIPDVATPTSNHENYVVWEGLGGELTGGTSSVPSLSGDNNINIAQSFQNYVLNFEEEILQGTNTTVQAYDPSQTHTVSERIFWRWMAQLNTIRFRDASVAESTTNFRYVEEDPTQYYNKVVRYIGDIDVVNNVSRGGNAYSEIYINIPTNHGGTPLVMWKTYEDPNYGPNRTWNNGNTFISGRTISSVHPSGLDLRAYYDDDQSLSYNTYSAFGVTGNWSGFVALPGGGSSKPVLLSHMDGIILDFDANSYSPIVNDGTISTIDEFNATTAAPDFSFNAALVYYDSYSASNSGQKATNLYGILILDDYINSAVGNSYIKRFDKYKPNNITKLNGNSYSLKIDIKFDSTVINAGVETLINDYNTFSMDLFIDASTRLQEAAAMFIDSELEIITIKNRLKNLENFYFTQEELTTLSQRLSDLEKSLNNAKLSFSSSTTLLDLINVNADNIENLLSGKLSVNLTYNTNVLKQGSGVFLDRSVPNQVTISNKLQGVNAFSQCRNTINTINTLGTLRTDYANGIDPTDTYLNNVLVLGEFSNYYRHRSTSHPNVVNGIEVFQDNVIINIQDSPITWKNGQTFKIVFADPIDFSGKTIYIRTDSRNRMGFGNYGTIIGTMDASMQITNKPIIEITCTDENRYTFNIDIIR